MRAIALLALAAGCGSGTPARLYEITIENLGAGQPLAPALVALHGGEVTLFHVGERASADLDKLARAGDPKGARDTFVQTPGVETALLTDGPIARVGGSGVTRRTVTAIARDADRVSIATMLICTNDGFTGVDALELPTDQDPLIVDTPAYDAGVEKNDEWFPDIDDDCQKLGPVAAPPDGNGGTPEMSVIVPHAGVRGGRDLRADLHGFDEAVARITIRWMGVW